MMSVETIGIFGVAQNALERASSAAAFMAALTSSLVTFFSMIGGQVDHAAGGDGHAQRDAGELALESRNHQADRFGGAGGGGDDVLGGARAR